MSRFSVILTVLLFFTKTGGFAQAGAADDKPYVLATKMPEFPQGGSQGMIEFIQEHLEYPEAEKKADIQGTIMMQFIVEKDGSLSDIKAIQSVPNGDNLVKEATRVIKLMPKWKPGMQDGQNVRVYKNVPFYFVLAKKKTNTHHNNSHQKSHSKTQTVQVKEKDAQPAATGTIATIDETRPQEEVFSIVEEMPQFPGGQEAFVKYLAKNIKYPLKEKEAKVEGKVFVTFIVEKDGTITNVKVLKGVPDGQGLDAEAVRVISSMPGWKPGKQNGRAVRVSMNQPIKFSLQ